MHGSRFVNVRVSLSNNIMCECIIEYVDKSTNFPIPKTSITGLIIPGGFGTRGVEGKIAAAHWARTTGKPLLGVCLGLQCAVIEFARYVLLKKDAHTTEIDPNTTNPVVIDMPEHNTGELGGTMRLGKRQTIFKTKDSILRQLYGNQVSNISYYAFREIVYRLNTQ